MIKFVFLMLASVAAMAGTLSVKVENQQIIAKACNLKPQTKAVWFFVGQKGYAKNGIGQRENSFENNCAVKTYNNTSNDLFLKGGEVYAAYDEAGKQAIQTNPETVAIPGNSQQPPATSNPISSEISLSYQKDGTRVQVLICASPEYLTLGKVVAINNLTKQSSTGQYTGSTNLSKKMLGNQRCAEHFYNQKEIDNGDKLIVVVGNDQKEFIVRGLDAGNNNPPPVVTPEDPRKEMDPKKVQIYAEQAANFFANRVVDIYGRVENYKYNFYLGFKRAAALYSNLGISIQNLPQYSDGKQTGLSAGYQDGYRSGQQKGTQDGNYLGKQTAVNRFQNAVGHDADLDITPGSGPNGQDFQGLVPSLSNPDLTVKLQSYNNDYYSEIRTEYSFDAEVDFDSDLSGNIYGASISLSDYYAWNDYKNDILFSYWKSENAFSLFLSKRLIKNSSVDYNKVKANNELIAKFKEITDSSQYKDADENRRIYRNTFINQYDDVIGNKWNREVYQRSNPTAQTRGEYYFTKAIKAYAYDVGYKQGYSANYTERSMQGYQNTVGPAYFQSFNNTVTYYSQNPVIENVQLSLSNQEGKNTFAAIDNAYVILSSAVNYGKVAGKIRVQLFANSLLSPTANNLIEMELPGLTRITKVQNLGAIGNVSTEVKPDGQEEILLKTNLGDMRVTLSTPWKQNVQQIAKDTPQRQQIIAQYLSNHLGKEMQAMKSVFKKNKYKSEPENTLAGKFVEAYKVLSPNEKQALNPYQSTIVSKIGKRPSFCIFCGKDEWDSAQDIFKEINWSLPR